MGQPPGDGVRQFRFLAARLQLGIEFVPLEQQARRDAILFERAAATLDLDDRQKRGWLDAGFARGGDRRLLNVLRQGHGSPQKKSRLARAAQTA